MKSVISHILDRVSAFFDTRYDALIATTDSLLSAKNYSAAIPLVIKVVRRQKRHFGENHPVTTEYLEILGNLYFNTDNFRMAAKYYLMSINSRSGSEEIDLIALAEAYTKLGEASAKMDHIDGAIESTKMSLELQYQNSDSINMSIIDNLIRLASYYSLANGHEPLREIIQILQPLIRDFSFDSELEHARLLINLATFELDIGDYEHSLDHCKEAISIYEGLQLPNEDPEILLEYTDCFTKLTIIYLAIGDYENANKALAKYNDKTLYVIPKMRATPWISSDTVKTLNLIESYINSTDLMGVSNRIKNCSTVEEIQHINKQIMTENPLLQLKLDPRSKHLDDNDYLTGWYHMLEAHKAYSLRKFNESYSLFKKAFAILNGVTGQNYYVLNALNGMGISLIEVGEFQKAISYLNQALELVENMVSQYHIKRGEVLHNLAHAHACNKEPLKSYECFTQCHEIENYFIDNILDYTSEDQKLLIIRLINNNLTFFMSLIDKYFSNNKNVIQYAHRVWCKRKNFVYQSQKLIHDIFLSYNDPKLSSLIHQLNEVGNKLSTIAYSLPSEDKITNYQETISILQNKKEELEIEISRLRKPYNLQQENLNIEYSKLHEMFPKNTVLLNFIQTDINSYDFFGNNALYDNNYFVFVLNPSDNFAVKLINLGPVSIIDAEIFQFKEKLMNDLNTTVNSKNLFNLLFKPIYNLIQPANTIFVIPDGKLSFIPFEIFIGPSNDFLISSFNFNYLNSIHDVYKFGQIKFNNQKSILFGNPDFDYIKESSLNQDYYKNNINKVTTTELKNLVNLKKSEIEVKIIQKIIGESNSEIFLGKDANEYNLKGINSPNILHLATHAVFIQKDGFIQTGKFNSTRGMKLKKSKKTQTGKIIIGSHENPFLRSFIALAGANQSLSYNAEMVSDGILTAQEILGLNLFGTDMVVLSACETGLGDLMTWEGVFGLRRAFALAGAKSVIMSMWTVEDEWTKDLMVEFYKNIFIQKLDRCQALRQAALTQMEHAKEKFGYANPFYWGAFVFSGDPGDFSNQQKIVPPKGQ